MTSTNRALAIASLLTLSGVAAGSDGIIELNQACAVQTGCLPGDSPGFPVTIATPGSYRLTSNLSQNLALLQPAATGIEITVEHVSLDLNGFAITCVAQFLDGTGPCTNGGGSGVSGTRPEIRVMNGFVTGFPQRGVDLSTYSHVQGLTVGDNRLTGIYVEERSIVHDCIVRRNGGDGISIAHSAIARKNTSSENEGDGIQALSGSLVEGNTCTGNTGFGIRLQDGATGYLDNVLLLNTAGSVSGGTSLGGNLCQGSVC